MRIVVLGIGKMGRWLATSLAFDNEVFTYDVVPQKAVDIPQTSPISDPRDLASLNPDLLINSVDLKYTVAAFRNVKPYLPSSCLLCDVASIKKDVAEYYRQGGFRFVSIHPMFGPTFSDMETLRKENAIIIQGSEPEGVGLFLRFFGALGLRIFEVSFEEHDELMAYSLATPFVASLVFAGCMDRTAVPGSTFARHAKIAKGVLSEDDGLLSEILFSPHVLNQIDKIKARLETLQTIIRNQDRQEMSRFFDSLRQNISS